MKFFITLGLDFGDMKLDQGMHSSLFGLYSQVSDFGVFLLLFQTE